ncbi:hypothetical protein [Candidatus Magnetomonas plexicatena]|uniref:hypothetical protein n=1 Tax=Candidatus Magnetomonas plexicatena TaxID=2552947 RepID=UPI00110408DD|nr:hypothetical protein E2O03_003795 [Nitrospirales bacterium LBB_01]
MRDSGKVNKNGIRRLHSHKEKAVKDDFTDDSFRLRGQPPEMINMFCIIHHDHVDISACIVRQDRDASNCFWCANYRSMELLNT